MKHYLWAIIYYNPSTGRQTIHWRVTTDPHPTHLGQERWVQVAEFVW